MKVLHGFQYKGGDVALITPCVRGDEHEEEILYTVGYLSIKRPY